MMKYKFAMIFAVAALFLSACGGGAEPAKTEEKPASENKNTGTAAKKEEKKEFTGEVKFPVDFPKSGTTAKKGEHVLVPSYNWLVEAMQDGVDKTTMIWYAQKMEEPGEEASMVKFMSETKKVPNAYIVPIAAGASAKNGDIILTWWQTGSGMQRAIVTDASDARAPVVRYLNLKFDNPAKDREKGTGIGQTDYKIKPDTFVVLSGDMQPGSSVAIGTDMKHGQVIRAEGDKVFVRLFAGKIGVFPKSDVTAVPLKPNVKAGDKVKIPFVGRFKGGSVVKVDAKIGRVWVKYDDLDKEEVIAFGDIIPN